MFGLVLDDFVSKEENLCNFSWLCWLDYRQIKINQHHLGNIWPQKQNSIKNTASIHTSCTRARVSGFFWCMTLVDWAWITLINIGCFVDLNYSLFIVSVIQTKNLNSNFQCKLVPWKLGLWYNKYISELPIFETFTGLTRQILGNWSILKSLNITKNKYYDFNI